MRRRFEIYKNIPLGVIIKKDLRKRKMSQKDLAHHIGMSYKSLNNAINGHRLFNSEEAAKLDIFFEYENNFIRNIQNYTQAKIDTSSRSRSNAIVSIPIIRPCVFWDVAPESIDWVKHHKFIVNRVSVYGNQSERKAVEEYYAKIRK